MRLLFLLSHILIMLCLTVIFTVIAASTVSIKEVHSTPAQGIGIDNFLQSLQQQLQQEQIQRQYQEQQELTSRQDDEEGGDTSTLGALRNEDVEQLIRLATNYIGDSGRYKKRQQYRIEDNENSSEAVDLYQQLREELNLLQNVQDSKNRQNRNRFRVKQRLQPNSLLGAHHSNQLMQSLTNDDKDDDESGSSNVYLILNPDALQRSKNKDKINNLLSNLLFYSSSRKRDHRERRQDQRYKGFGLKDDNTLVRRRRLNKESRESNSMEREFKPKKSRGRGGGGSGRTAIPYIRNHADIYERDN